MIKTYYAPNPYVKGEDEPFIIYCEMVKEILASPNHEVNFYDFFNKWIGGKSDDILLNAINPPNQIDMPADRTFFYIPEILVQFHLKLRSTPLFFKKTDSERVSAADGIL